MIYGLLRVSQVAPVVKNPPAKAGDTTDDPWVLEDPPEEEMPAPSSVPAWRIPGTGEPGGLQSMGSQRVGHDRNDLACMHGLLKKRFWLKGRSKLTIKMSFLKIICGVIH